MPAAAETESIVDGTATDDDRPGKRQRPAAAGPEVQFSKTREVGSTRWLRLETLTFTDEKGTAGRAWDRVVRTTKQSETSTDAVAILAVLKETQQQQRAGAATAAGGEGGGGESETVVLVKQFRPPINAYTVELPAVSGSSSAPPALRRARPSVPGPVQLACSRGFSVPLRERFRAPFSAGAAGAHR